jgi:hypothetical protein
MMNESLVKKLSDSLSSFKNTLKAGYNVEPKVVRVEKNGDLHIIGRYGVSDSSGILTSNLKSQDIDVVLKGEKKGQVIVYGALMRLPLRRSGELVHELDFVFEPKLGKWFASALN